VYATEASDASPVGVQRGPAASSGPEFRVIDLTFINAQVGWALGQRQVPRRGSPGICPAVMRTDDGGSNWLSTPNRRPTSHEGRCCDVPCVNHLRFANQDVGYASARAHCFMTVDGVSRGDRMRRHVVARGG